MGFNPRIAESMRLKAILQHPAFWAAVMAVVAFSVYALTFADETPFNHYVLLADAFLHGRVDLADPPIYIENTAFRGRHYVIPPPFPAILLMPYVAFRGTAANQSLVSYLLGGLAAGLATLIAARIAPRRGDYLWLGALAAFGTIMWNLAASGSTWYFAHVVVVTALTAGVLESLGRRRALVVGALVATAYLTRQATIMALVFFVLVTLPRWAPRGLRAWREIQLGYLNRLTAPVATAVVLNSIYNWVRFGTISDVANLLRPGILNEPWFDQGLFHYSYIPRHLDALFARLPGFIATPPYVLVPWTGLALWITTPAFLYALRAPWNRETLAAWLGVGAVLLVVFMFGNPGVTQFGYRFASDIYPMLFLLTARGMGGRVPRCGKALIVLSILVNLWGVAWLRLGWIAP